MSGNKNSNKNAKEKYEKIAAVLVMHNDTGALFEASVINPPKGHCERMVLLESDNTIEYKYSVSFGLFFLEKHFTTIGEV